MVSVGCFGMIESSANPKTKITSPGGTTTMATEKEVKMTEDNLAATTLLTWAFRGTHVACIGWSEHIFHKEEFTHVEFNNDTKH